jgi:hypothetical protein
MIDPSELGTLLREVLDALNRLNGLLSGFRYPHLIVQMILDDTLVLLYRVWYGFVLHTTDFETGHDFTSNSTVQHFEPAVQAVANAALVLVAIWASYRIMWGHGTRSQYTARVMLPRLLMGVVLVNFSMPIFQAVIQASNTVCDAIQSFGTIDLQALWNTFRLGPGAAWWQIVATAVLALGYDVLAIAYLIRYTILIVLAITSPLAGLLFVLPDTHHLAAKWRSLFLTNLFMQPAQLFVLTVGFGLENGGTTPVHHLFALATLLIVFKVPGAMGGAEKAAHKLESLIDHAVKGVEKGVEAGVLHV